MSQPFDPKSLHAEFRDEARGQLNVLDEALAEAERTGTLGEEQRSELARALHTLKGNAGMLGFAPISSFVHELEEVFRTPVESWTPRLPSLVRSAALLRAASVAAGTDDEAEAFAALERPDLDAQPRDAPTEQPDEPGQVERVVASSRADELTRVPFHRLDALLGGVGDLISVSAALTSMMEDYREGLDACGFRRPLEAYAARVAMIVDEVRRTVMDLRLVPAGRLFTRFPSLARDLAVRAGKSVRVEIEGESTELDKSTLDALAEPLLHLVRNAVAHGIEGPDERALQGKPAYGTVTLRAARDGEKVRIDVEDDGRGLDLEAIERGARARGWVAEGEELTESDVTEWILRPEFSTLDTAAEEAGRGVGLHAVRRTTTELHGSLTVKPLDQGTLFTIMLPLRVMVVPSVVFEAAGETLALPAAEVIEAVRRSDGAVTTAGLARVDGMTVPVASLAAVFGGTAREDGEPYLLLAHGPAGPIAIEASRLYHRQDLVVRGIPPYLGSIEGVSGAAVMPSGSVVLLLDALQLPDLLSGSLRGAEARHA
ncbi:MAG TPA: Hpt domain-containing protein [Longimicrobiales bacterium]|nr:Hpt domain-containing protein [Longimicrobiales bacterium]